MADVTAANAAASAAVTPEKTLPPNGAGVVAQPPKCTDTIDKHADPYKNPVPSGGLNVFDIGLEFFGQCLGNRRHLVLFDGELEAEFCKTYLKPSSGLLIKGLLWLRFDATVTRNTLCNNIDTMNKFLLRAGKPRIHVRGIAQQGKIDYDVFGKPLDEQDADAMMVLFCEKLAGAEPVQIGAKKIDLSDNLEFQRSLRKATDNIWRFKHEKIVEQLQSTIETGRRERGEQDAQLAAKDAEIARLTELLSATATDADAVADAEPSCLALSEIEGLAGRVEELESELGKRMDVEAGLQTELGKRAAEVAELTSKMQRKKAKADSAQQRADSIQQRADSIQQRADSIQQRADDLQAQLRDTLALVTAVNERSEMQLAQHAEAVDRANAAVDRANVAADEARAQANADREKLQSTLVVAATANSAATRARMDAAAYKAQRDQASHRQRTASKVVSKFVECIEQQNTGLLQAAMQLAYNVRDVIYRYDWGGTGAQLVQQQITDMLEPRE